MKNFRVQVILNVPVANITLAEAPFIIASLIDKPGKKIFFAVNPHGFNLIRRNENFRKAFRKATLVYPEGTGVVLASKILGTPLRGRVNFFDFMPTLLTIAQKKKWSIYLLGGTKEVSRIAVKKLREQFPQLAIVGHHDGYFNSEEEKNIISTIEKKRPTIVFVAMSPPLQELWIVNNIKKLHAKAFFGIGGYIDILAGRIPRAPFWVRKAGLEWLFRVLQEPRRLWKKYFIGNSIFLFWVILELIRNKQPKYRNE